MRFDRCERKRKKKKRDMIEGDGMIITLQGKIEQERCRSTGRKSVFVM
jgi:hypothetical protein